MHLAPTSSLGLHMRGGVNREEPSLRLGHHFLELVFRHFHHWSLAGSSLGPTSVSYQVGFKQPLLGPSSSELSSMNKLSWLNTIVSRDFGAAHATKKKN